MALNPEKQRINLLVDRTELGLVVAPDEEPLYRRARDLYNERVNAYRAKYGSSVTDIDADSTPRLMAALEIAIQLEISREERDPRPVEERLGELCSHTEAFLKRFDA